jgi:potassium efflux system protein
MVLSLCLLGAPAWCAETQPTPAGAPPAVNPQEGLVDLDSLKTRRAMVEDMKELDEAAKKQVLTALDQAIQLVEQSKKYQQAAADLGQRVQEAPKRIQTINAELARPLPTPESLVEQAAQLPVNQLEQTLHQMQAELAQAQNTLNSTTAKLREEETALQHTPEALTQAKARLRDLRNPAPETANVTDASLVGEAHRSALLAEQTMLQAEIALLQQRLAAHDSITALLAAERDLAARNVSQIQATIAAYQDRLQALRQQEATTAREKAEEAKHKALQLPPPMKEQYDINIALSAKLEKLTQQEALLTKKLEQTQNQLKELKTEFDLARERVDALALTGAVGLALREQRRSLPSANEYRQHSLERQRQMSEIREGEIELESRQRSLLDVDAQESKILDAVPSLLPEERIRLSTELGDLLVARRALMDKLQVSYRRNFKLLRNVEFTEQQLIGEATAFAAFLDKHLLWIRSSEPLSLQDLRNLPAVLGWLVNSQNWRQFRQDLWTSLTDRTPLWLLGLIITGLLVSARKWARRKLTETASKVGPIRTDSFALTVEAFVLTLLLAVRWPFLMGFVGYQILSLPQVSLFSQAVATGLLTSAISMLILTFFLQLCRSGGLAQAHFRWPQPVRGTIRRHLAWLTPLVVVLEFFLAAAGVSKNLEYSDSLARLALLVQGTAGALFWALAFRFSGGIVSSMISRQPTSWLTRLRYVWYPLSVAMPLATVLLVAFGYYYSALEWRNLTGETVILLISLVVFHDLTLRWLTLAHRKMVLKEALRKHAARQEAEQKAGGVKTDAVSIEAPEIGLDEINEQTRALLNMVIVISALVGLWTIWNQAFKAFEFLTDIHLWTYSSVVDGTTRSVPISMADVLLAILIAVSTFLASRNLPGLLEMTVLRRLPLDFGGRYAFTTLCRYVIIALGVIVAFSYIGINWSSIQWLVAALGVGLGFGLQEIVVNFVCGLIVLFERPFRVGDTVTIGDTTGTVSRIRIRATTIVDWDRKELIVPNKEFITGRLVNWSLSDQVLRIIVPVGIAYGSDTQLAEELLLKAAQDNPKVLKEPKSYVIFKGFGDNSLNFDLRVYINGIDDWIPMLHRLNQTIDREFRQAGIAIAFPQRDMHLDTSKPLEIRVVSAGTGSGQATTT